MIVLFYLLESNLYLVTMYSFYRAILHRETFHQLNRWYLLAAMVLAFTIPLLKVDYRPALGQEQSQQNNTQVVAGNLQPVPSVENTYKQFSTLPRSSKAVKASTNVTAPAVLKNPIYMLLVGYLTVTLLCLSRTFASLLRIINLYHLSPKFSSAGVTHVLLKQEKEAFSFFNWLFYHPSIQPESAIIVHELVHIRQKHSWDLLFFDLVFAVSWFNPVLYTMRRDMKLNHEYLADEQASRQCINRHAYALLLIDHSGGKVEWRMTHQMFSARQLKARILRLSKQRSAGKAKLKYVLALPVLAVIFSLFAFTTSKDYALINLTFIKHNMPPGHARLTSVPVFGVQSFSNAIFGALKKEQKPDNPSTVPLLPVVNEQNIVPTSDIKMLDTVPPGTMTASIADSLRNKQWAPQYIQDSVQKYEWAAKLISDRMKNDGQKASEILTLIQKERFVRYYKIQGSSKKEMAAVPAEDRTYHITFPKEVADQATKDRLSYVDLLISRIKACYPEMQRLLQASNAFRSQVKDSFPMYVSKTGAQLDYYISLDGIGIPAPLIKYKGAWVNNETERATFFADPKEN